MTARRRSIIPRGQQWAWHTVEALGSPAWRVLSLSGRRVLDRIEIEHASHGGKDNGNLPVTYDDFVKYGIDRHAVAPAIREVEALGFIEITEHGRGGNAEYRMPNKFRLTHLPTGKDRDTPATDEWKRVKTTEEAEAIARAARKPLKRVRPTKNSAAKKQKPVGEKTRFGVGNQH
jgi:hypothetical protein